MVNAFTLHALLTSKLIPTGDNDLGSAIGNFFQKVGKVAEDDPQSALIYSGMFFTLVIWVFGVLSLLLAALFWVFFLWHYCPQSQGGLHGFCEKKSNKKLASIVSVKVNKALEEEERKRRKQDAKAMKKGEQPQFGRQATLPTLFNPTDTKEDKPAIPTLNRNDTVATLPTYTSRPGTPGGPPTTATFELNDLESKRPPPGRTLTNTSYASNAPLMGNASDMGYGRPESPAPSLPPSRGGYPAPIRTMTGSSQRSQWSQPQTPMDDRVYTASPLSYANQPSLPSHMSTVSGGSQVSIDSYSQPFTRPNERSYTPAGLAPSMGRRTPFNDNAGSAVPYPMDFDDEPLPPRGPSEFGRSSPALSAIGQGQPQQYQAFNPQNRAASSASPAPYSASSTPRDPQMRSVTEPGRPQDYYGQSRPGTAQSNRPPRGPPQDYFGDARPGTAQSNRMPTQQRKPSQDYYGDGVANNRPPPNSQRSQDYYDDERPGTAQSRRPVPQEYYSGERPGTAQSRRPVPQSQGSLGGADSRQPRLPDLGDGTGYSR